jgi:hypothetical protein
VSCPKEPGRWCGFYSKSSIFQTEEEIYGIRGGHAMSTRCGRNIFKVYRENLSPLMKFLDLEVKLAPHAIKSNTGLILL